MRNATLLVNFVYFSYEISTNSTEIAYSFKNCIINNKHVALIFATSIAPESATPSLVCINF